MESYFIHLAKQLDIKQTMYHKEWRLTDKQLVDFANLVLASKWKSMDSAPRDGTRLLLKQDGKIYIGYFCHYSSVYFHSYDNWITGWNREYDCPELVLWPSAWMEISE